MNQNAPVLFEDKNGILSKLDTLEKVIIDLGCGDTKIQPDAIGVDVLDSPAVDVVGDARGVLGHILDSKVDAILSHHFMEHVGDVAELLSAIHRVLKIGGYTKITVPHFSNPYFYSDPTHKQFFGLYTFNYYATCNLFKRTVPSYSRVPGLELEQAKLAFKSFPPNYMRHGFKKMLEVMVNATNWTKEAYEENLTGIFPCYEIQAVLRKVS
jgi:ubiquinone/menaquinone biosynthesis C-methylase UbiE